MSSTYFQAASDMWWQGLEWFRTRNGPSQRCRTESRRHGYRGIEKMITVRMAPQ